MSVQRSGGTQARRQRLTPEAITEAAMGLADAKGLDAVSIRRVAAALDARPMSLYGHFASKSDLMAAMADEASGEMLVPSPLPEEWRQAMTLTARQAFQTYLAHPWLISAYARRPDPGPNSVKMAKQAARSLSSLPLDQDAIWQVQGIVNDYIIGYAYRLGASPDPKGMEKAMAASDVVEFPELSALPDSFQARRTLDRFELGLQTVLDGVERRFLGRPQ